MRKLLKLSALPLPSEPAAQEALLDAVRAQVGFVDAIRKVDTTGVRPLVRIADESKEGVEEDVLTLAKLGLDREGEGIRKKSWTGRSRRLVEEADVEDAADKMIATEDTAQRVDEGSTGAAPTASFEEPRRDALSFLDDPDPNAKSAQANADPPTATLDDLETPKAPLEARKPWDVATMAGSRMRGRYFVVRRPSPKAKVPDSPTT